MQREYKISLSQEYYSDVVYLSQYDDDYDVIFHVINKYSAADVGGKSAKFTGTRTDGLGFTFNAVAVGSSVAFHINTSLTACAGTHTAEIVFYDSNDLYFGSANVQVIVEKAAHPEGTIDADEEQLRELAEQVQEIVDTAAAEVKGEAESWAVGERDGVPVPSTDPTYHNNAKYYAQQAAQTAEDISGVTDQVAQNTSDIGDLKEDLSENTKNLVDVKKVSGSNVTVQDGVVSGTASALTTAFKGANGGLFPWLTFEENTQYTFSFYAKNDTGGANTNGLAIYCKYSDDSTSAISINNNVTSYTKQKITTTAGKTLVAITVSYVAQGGYVWHLKDLQVEKGTAATEYIPFVTATDYAARNALDALDAATDAQFEAVNGQLTRMNSKNLFNKAYTKTTSGVTYACTGDGYVTLNGSNNADVYFDISTLAALPLESGKEYWVGYGCESDTLSSLTIYYNYGSGLVKADENLVGFNKITVPAGITDLLLRLYTKADAVFSNTKYALTISEAKSNKDLAVKSAQFRFVQAFGTGDSTIIKFNDGTVLVIDFGLDEPQGTLHRNWKRALTDLGVTHIDYAIISHYHSDHVGMLIDTDTTATDYVDVPALLDSNTTFFLPGNHPFTQDELDALAWVDTMAGDHNVQNYTAVMSLLNTKGCKIVFPDENDKWLIGGCEVQFWNADQEWIMQKYIDHETYDYNEASLCCYITIGSNRINFSGDVGTQAMDKYKKTVLASNIYKANHHAVGYGIVPLFLSSVMPSLVVTMIGYNLAQGLGSSALQAWCEANCVPNVVTGINDHNLHLYVDEGGYRWDRTCRRLICADEGIST